jgi:hypothetical protein
MSYSVNIPVESNTHDAFGFVKDDHQKSITQELKQFVTCIHNNEDRLVALCSVDAIDAFAVNPEVCVKLPKGVLSTVMFDFVELLLTKKFKFNGKQEDWSIGSMGNRWLNMKAESYDVDFVRAAFYSKKTSKREWKSDKPYRIQITVEKVKSGSLGLLLYK